MCPQRLWNINILHIYVLPKTYSLLIMWKMQTYFELQTLTFFYIFIGVDEIVSNVKKAKIYRFE